MKIISAQRIQIVYCNFIEKNKYNYLIFTSINAQPLEVAGVDVPVSVPISIVTLFPFIEPLFSSILLL